MTSLPAHRDYYYALPCPMCSAIMAEVDHDYDVFDYVGFYECPYCGYEDEITERYHAGDWQLVRKTCSCKCSIEVIGWRE